MPSYFDESLKHERRLLEGTWTGSLFIRLFQGLISDPRVNSPNTPYPTTEQIEIQVMFIVHLIKNKENKNGKNLFYHPNGNYHWESMHEDMCDNMQEIEDVKKRTRLLIQGDETMQLRAHKTQNSRRLKEQRTLHPQEHPKYRDTEDNHEHKKQRMYYLQAHHKDQDSEDDTSMQVSFI